MGKYKKQAGIYQILNISNRKCYIGHSTGIKNRMASHRNRLRANKHKNKHLQSAWNLEGEDKFKFFIIENLPLGLTKQQYEEIETKWVLHYNSHKSEFGYNSCLPGNFPLKNEDENITSLNRENNIPKKEIYVINIETREIELFTTIKEVKKTKNIPANKLLDRLNYWSGKNTNRKSYKGFIYVRKEEYNPNFDYINFTYRKKLDYSQKKTWKDYKYKKPKKDPKDIIPHSERNLKRIPILAVNIDTGEEIQYSSISEAYPTFKIDKVRKCIYSPYMKYKHRNHYFKII